MVRFWRIDEDCPVQVAPLSNGLCCAFSTDGSVLAAGTHDGSVYFWATPRQVPSLQHICRMSIRRVMSTQEVQKLPVPSKILAFLSYRGQTEDCLSWQACQTERPLQDTPQALPAQASVLGGSADLFNWNPLLFFISLVGLLKHYLYTIEIFLNISCNFFKITVKTLHTCIYLDMSCCYILNGPFSFLLVLTCIYCFNRATICICAVHQSKFRGIFVLFFFIWGH